MQSRVFWEMKVIKRDARASSAALTGYRAKKPVRCFTARMGITCCRIYVLRFFLARANNDHEPHLPPPHTAPTSFAFSPTRRRHHYVNLKLYHLDLRLCAQWFGSGMEPPEKDRIRHDQWVPLSSSSLRKPDQHENPLDDRNTSGRRDSTTTSGGQVRSGDAAKNATVGRSIAGDLSLSGLSEVQEEEMVLVHSFLNSQPQISALPPGQADYEDHVSKKLHWIDRPCLSKLAAVGRLSSDKRKPLLVPVSPGTGRPVPERPANSSYNAMSREAKPPTKKGSVIVGILKKTGKHPKADITCCDKSRTETQSSESATSESQIDPSTSGEGTAAGPMGEGRGEETAQGRVKQAGGSEGRSAARARTSDEVVVEDLSEARLDQRSCATITDAGDATRSRREDTDWREEESVRRHVQVNGNQDSSLEEDSVPRIAGARGHNSRLSERPPDAPPTQGAQNQHASSARRLSTGKLEPDCVRNIHREERSGASGHIQTKSQPQERPAFGREQEVSSAPVMRGKEGSRQGDRQAWDGETGPETDEGGIRARGRRSSGDRYGEVGSQDLSASGSDRNGISRYAPTAPSSAQSHGGVIGSGDLIEDKTSTKISAGKRRPGAKDAQQRDVVLNGCENHDNGVSNGVSKSTVAGLATQDSMKLTKPTARRVDSEGSLTFPIAEIASYLPQAPAMRRSSISAKTNAADPPECGELNSGDRRRETMSTNRQGGEEREAPEDVYLVGSGGASLQQLAQTPNPQQRRLPSPRPQQDFHQVGAASFGCVGVTALISVPLAMYGANSSVAITKQGCLLAEVGLIVPFKKIARMFGRFTNNSSGSELGSHGRWVTVELPR